MPKKPSAPTYPTFRGRDEADVVVVGAGFTGALVAQVFAESGVSVVVLQRGRVGAGSTVASSALLLQEPDRELGELDARYGRHVSRHLWRLSQEAVHDTIALLRRLRIRCDLVTRDSVYYAATGNAVERLHREYALRRRAGFDAEWLTPRDLRRTTGIPSRGGIRTRGNAQFDPYSACIGLFAAASAAGARIFEHSPATRIEATRAAVRVHTRHGAVEARRVIIATGYATAQFRPLAGRFRMSRTYVLATTPMSASQRAELGLSDLIIWDTDRPYHYARWTDDHRLLLGGADRPVRPGPHRSTEFTHATRDLRDYFERRLPALADVETEFAWEGLFALTSDSFPYIGPHRRYPHQWFALGYGGNGMTFGFLAARLLLERWRGRPSTTEALFRFDRVSSRPGRV